MFSQEQAIEMRSEWVKINFNCSSEMADGMTTEATDWYMLAIWAIKLSVRFLDIIPKSLRPSDSVTRSSMP